MSGISINTIARNPGASSQSYRIEYRLHGDPAYIAGPTLSYDQAQTYPAGLLPLLITTPDGWADQSADVRIITICGQQETAGDAIEIDTIQTPCGPR